MVKKLLLVILLVTLCISSRGWGETGHKTIANIAYSHLDAGAKSKILSYLGTKTEFLKSSVYPDSKRYDEDWRRDLGQEISNPEILWPGKTHDEVMTILGGVTRYEPWCHSFTVNSSFYCLDYNIQGTVYVRNCVMDIQTVANALRDNIGSMSTDQIKQYISLIIHLVGDGHCPMHTLYDPDAPTGGSFTFYIGTKTDENKYSGHSFWDTGIFKLTHDGWNYVQFSTAADDSSEAMRQIISAGSLNDWFRMSSIYCWQCQMYNGTKFKSGTVVSDTYPQDMEPVLLHQLRDAGYRLAALLNYIFK